MPSTEERRRILILGGGFAGLWSAAGAARQLEQLGESGSVEITLVNRDPYHSIRVRNYEADLAPARVPLQDVLQPIGVRQLVGEVTQMLLNERMVQVRSTDTTQTLNYDRLIIALGSQVQLPAMPGLAQWAFDVDTYSAAVHLNAHLERLSNEPVTPQTSTIVVVGGGPTGIEAATELPAKLAALGAANRFRIVLISSQEVGATLGTEASAVVMEALAALEIEVVRGRVAAVDASGVTLNSGQQIPSAAIVWCGGMEAHPLTRTLGLELDPQGRIPVDEYMRVQGVPDVFACGDAAVVNLDGHHHSLMSCQHARPMGRFAGHNAVCDLFGISLLPLHIPWYVTVVDLGSWGALYTQGWEPTVVAVGEEAKQTKLRINTQRIYPPLSGNRADIFEAAAPTIQPPPQRFKASSGG